MFKRRRGEKGVAAVETALMLPIVLILLFGTIDYGLYFTNAVSVRQGVREAARAVVVLDPETEAVPFEDAGGACGLMFDGTTGSLAPVNCATEAATAAVSGTTIAAAQLYTPDLVATDQWQVGNYLLVCGAIQDVGLTGLTPMPNGGEVQSTVIMRIENDKGFPTGQSLPTVLEEAPADFLTGDPTTWSFCAP